MAASGAADFAALGRQWVFGRVVPAAPTLQATYHALCWRVHWYLRQYERANRDMLREAQKALGIEAEDDCEEEDCEEEDCEEEEDYEEAEVGEGDLEGQEEGDGGGEDDGREE